jgi:NAD(P)-dependent dehydrogenase (short-subunit alcohol dehydrogenase family)
MNLESDQRATNFLEEIMLKPGLLGSNRVALVTGGASGIGRAFSEAMARAGYRVVIADLRDAEPVAQALGSDGAEVMGFTLDVSDSDAVRAVVEEVCHRWGRLDVLVNNAGLFANLKPGGFEQISDDEWMRVMRINTLGPFVCAKAVVPLMRLNQFGRIINIASSTVLKGTPGLLHYVASKGAVVAFTRSLARELGGAGITVNAISPGFTLSEGVLANSLQTQVGDVVRSRSIQRDQLPEDLVGTLLHLAGDAAAFVTGQTLVVDGGGVFV